MIRVLIVEDEPPILRSIKILIEQINSNFKVVDIAYNGDEAINKLSQSSYDVMFTDIMMPVSDGFNILSYINNNNIDIIPIILSGHAEFEYAQKAIKYNVFDYLLKPISYEKLSELLNNIEAHYKLHQKEAIVTDIEISDCSSTDQVMNSIEQYLLNNISSQITNQSLAAKYGFSASYLSKLFKEYRGISPSEFLTKIRIDKAKTLIEQNPKILIKTIVPLIGFSDQFYFSKIFKKYTSYTPKVYKEIILKKSTSKEEEKTL